MALDPSISLGYRQPVIAPLEIQTPLERFQKVLTLRGMMEAQQLRGLQMQQAQQELEQTRQAAENEAKFRALYADPNATPTPSQVYGTLGPKGAAVVKTQGEIQEQDIKTRAQIAARRGAIAGSILAGDSPAALASGVMQAVSEKVLDPAEARQLLAAGWTPETKALIRGHAVESLNYAQQLEAQQKAAEEARKVQLFGPQYAEAQAKSLEAQLGIAAQTAPDNQAEWDTWRAGLSPELQRRVPAMYSPVARQQVQMMGVKPAAPKPGVDVPWAPDVFKQQQELKATPPSSAGSFSRIITDPNSTPEQKAAAQQALNLLAGFETAKAAAGAQGRTEANLAAGGLTDDDFKRAGEQYARTGVMPALGRDSSTRSRVVHYGNEWARNNGLTAQDLVTMQAAYAGDKESLKKFQSQRDQIVSFEQTAQKNLDLFLNVASKIPDTGVPWLNKPLRNLDQSIVGSENMAAVNAARQIANNEIAKVTSGGGLSGVLSDSARREVEAYNPQNATFAQTKAVAKVLKADMANRHQSMDATLSDIRARIGGGGAPTTANPNPSGYIVGHRYGGLTYLGGDPNNRASWK